jgi:hypothetical protein
MRFRTGRRLTARAGLVGVVCGLTAGGCGSGAPYAESSRTQATVSGRVTAQGKPVTKGQIIFDPANVNRPTEPARTTELRADGTYDVTTLIGANRVTVAIPGRAAKAGFPYIQRSFDVKTGSNTFDVEIP